MHIPKLHNHYHVVIIGDVMLDHYIYGHVSRSSPEADIDILDQDQAESRLGGAANVAMNILGLGSSPILLSVVGDDETGRELIDLCAENRIRSEYILSIKGRKTTKKTRFYSGSEQLLRVDNEDIHDITEAASDKIMSSLESLISHQKVDAIILQDYNKGVLTAYNIPKIISLAGQLDIKVFVDPKEKNLLGYRDCYYYKPNLREVSFAVKAKVTPDTVKKYAVELNTILAAKTIVITLSEYGIYCLSGDYDGIVPCVAGQVVDVCGAGDSVISSLCICDLHGIALEESLQFANYAAMKVCQIIGAAPYNSLM